MGKDLQLFMCVGLLQVKCFICTGSDATDVDADVCLCVFQTKMQVDQDSQGEQLNEEGKAPGSNTKVLICFLMLFDTPCCIKAQGSVL